jgi:hypothetical protein
MVGKDSVGRVQLCLRSETTPVGWALAEILALGENIIINNMFFPKA